MIKTNDNLFSIAVDNNQIFEFLIGYNGYEIRLNIANMPTDVSMASYYISKYLLHNPKFDKNKIVDAFIELSKSHEWSWLLVYYTTAFFRQDLDFLPLHLLYENLQQNKEYLLNNKDWIYFNFSCKFNNLWEIIINENQKQNKKYNVPILK